MEGLEHAEDNVAIVEHEIQDVDSLQQYGINVADINKLKGGKTLWPARDNRLHLNTILYKLTGRQQDVKQVIFKIVAPLSAELEQHIADFVLREYPNFFYRIT